jgi:hypothetical protein
MISFELFIAIIAFVIVSVSFTFKNIINNMTAGAIMLASEQFEIGDLIQTNNIQGVVTAINLSYTELKEFDGVRNVIPNSNVYGSSISKFTHTEYRIEHFRKDAKSIRTGKEYRNYIQKVRRLISSGLKVTRYVKLVEFLGTIKPEHLENSLNNVFTKYEQIFGLRPGYGIEMTDFGRIKVYLYVVSDKSEKVLNNIDAFLRDIVYEVYNTAIFDGWKEYKEKNLELITNKAVDN